MFSNLPIWDSDWARYPDWWRQAADVHANPPVWGDSWYTLIWLTMVAGGWPDTPRTLTRLMDVIYPAGYCRFSFKDTP